MPSVTFNQYNISLYHLSSENGTCRIHYSCPWMIKTRYLMIGKPPLSPSTFSNSSPETQQYILLLNNRKTFTKISHIMFHYPCFNDSFIIEHYSHYSINSWLSFGIVWVIKTAAFHFRSISVSIISRTLHTRDLSAWKHSPAVWHWKGIKVRKVSLERKTWLLIPDSLIFCWINLSADLCFLITQRTIPHLCVMNVNGL